MKIFASEVKQLEKASILLANYPNEYKKAVSLARGRALSAARTQAVKSSSKRYDTKSAEIRKSIILNNSNGQMITRGSPLELMKFRVSPKSPGRKSVVQASVKGKGGTIGYAFIGRMPNGHIGVYKRVGQSRYPIKQLYSVSAAQMVGEEVVMGEVEDKAKQVFEERLGHEVDRVISRF